MIAIVALIVMLVVAMRFGKSNLIEIRDRFGWAAPLVSVPLQAVLAASPFPSDLICIANGAVYGYWPGVAASYIGWSLGSVIEFWILRGMVQGEPSPELVAKTPRWLRRFPAASPWFLILGRQIPWGGAHLTAISAVLAGVSWRRFLICNAIAVVPGALVMPAIGAKLL